MRISQGNYWKWACSAAVLIVAAPAWGAKSVSYYYTDPQGTVLAVTDASGIVVSSVDYAPYGASAMGNPGDGPGYTGHVADSDTDLIYMQARYYDPIVGRFVGIDPSRPAPGDPFGFNRFAYANNSPLVHIDPDGRNAIITYKQDGSISIAVPVRFSGPASTNPQVISDIKSNVAAKWSGLYNVAGAVTLVKVAIVDVDASTPKKAINNIQLVNGPTSDTTTKGASFVRGGNAGEWNVTSQGWSQGEAEHETGHLMMEKDHYSDTRDASGNRVTTADPGYESNLMGTLGKSVITDSQNMKSILSSNGNISVKEPPTSP
ncbi:RHS repeat-associated core domain-containing protein [Luteibacter sp. UNCMF366Tsu5.1]|uniref:RHS repeat-associated core domain-containing protein n=1 Tax=Luteibacter sp. UNCMF366Tsu5.1 TaxID=1502758 RepID=UPI000908A78B|nr:RHS repeat-associated core domain-containing protein [Luteibacter sp. UNCMF366Tsu5.1]SFW38032.1 RHS repeat-associated core domain-containing protein [Luteibacter sp. UNCMF366Tsu5.1]